MISESAAKLRAAPHVFILDEDFGVCFVGAHEAANVGRDILAAARLLVRDGGDQIEMLVDGAPVVLRIAELHGEPPMRYALFVEPGGSRRPLTDASRRFGLTFRELEVLTLIVDGASNREIAKALFIVEGTVQDHVRNLCAKVGAKRRGDLLAGVFGVDDL